MAADLLFGPLFYRMLFGHEPASESFISRVFQYVLTGLAGAAGAREEAREGLRFSGKWLAAPLDG